MISLRSWWSQWTQSIYSYWSEKSMFQCAIVWARCPCLGSLSIPGLKSVIPVRSSGASKAVDSYHGVPLIWTSQPCLSQWLWKGVGVQTWIIVIRKPWTPGRWSSWSSSRSLAWCWTRRSARRLTICNQEQHCCCVVNIILTNCHI